MQLITLFLGNNVLFNKTIIKKYIRKRLNKIKEKLKVGQHGILSPDIKKKNVKSYS